MTATPTTTKKRPYSVTEISQEIKKVLEKDFRKISIQGEISNFKKHSSGHLYFSLKDSGATLSAVMFRGSTTKLRTFPKDGDHVTITGDLNVYPPHGKYQMVVHSLELMGLGELLLKLEKLKVEIHRRGWFSKTHKQSPPKFPKKIGVVTSPTGAVIQDILNVIRRRFSGFQLLLYPVRVQGEGAAEEIARAIEDFNKYHLVDVMIIGRGGGSIEDLWAFNEEIVASAIFHSKIPTIAAIGHETDHTIADYVADIRAPTPSAAAEIVVSEKSHHLKILDETHRRLGQTLRHLVRQNRHRLEGIIRHPLFTDSYALLGEKFQQIDDLRETLDQNILNKLLKAKLHLQSCKKEAEALKPTAKILHFQERLRQHSKSLDSRIKQLIKLHSDRLTALVRNMQALDPKKLLSRGYSIVFAEKDHSVIVSKHQLKERDRLSLLLSDGSVIANVEKIVDDS